MYLSRQRLLTALGSRYQPMTERTYCFDTSLVLSFVEHLLFSTFIKIFLRYYSYILLYLYFAITFFISTFLFPID